MLLKSIKKYIIIVKISMKVILALLNLWDRLCNDNFYLEVVEKHFPVKTEEAISLLIFDQFWFQTHFLRVISYLRGHEENCVIFEGNSALCPLK